VITLTTIALTFFLAFPVPTSRSIEQAFLQNDAELLGLSFPRGGTVLVSLPDPISFSDQVSSEQAVLLFKRLFSLYRTTEFFIDPAVSFIPGKPGRIIKSRRWSFRNVRTGLAHPVRIYFYVVPGPAGRRPDDDRPAWTILEIRAEKL
jgi:hypothetical protein